MAVASLERINRREKVLLVLALVVAFSVYRSAPVPTSLDSGVVDGVLRLHPMGVDGRPAAVFILWGLYEIVGQITGAPVSDVVAFAAAVFGVLICALAYLVYRDLFDRKYVGIVALALMGSAPASVAAATGSGLYIVSLFFVALAVHAWLRRSWIVWGIALGLAISSHYASAALVFPAVSWLVMSRGSIERSRRLIVGSFLAVVIAASSYSWTLSMYGGLGQWIEGPPSLALGSPPSISLAFEHAVYLVAYVAAALALVRQFRSNPLVLRAILALLLVGVPYLFLLYVSRQALIDAGGVLLWVIALVSVPPLWIVDGRKREITFLLSWLVPLLILVPAFAGDPASLFLFAVFPLALLACRILDRTVDGEWLDFWWAIGLPTDWYYRLGKLAILFVLVLSFVQANRLPS